MAGTKRQTKQKIQEPILGSLKLDSMLPSSVAKGDCQRNLYLKRKAVLLIMGQFRGFHCVARDGAVQAGSDGGGGGSISVSTLMWPPFPQLSCTVGFWATLGTGLRWMTSIGYKH